VEEHPGDHHVEVVVFEGQPSHVAFVGDPFGWFRERASWASKASEIRSVGAGADCSRERVSSISAGAGFPVGRSKGVGFRLLQRRRRYGRWAPEQTVRERERRRWAPVPNFWSGGARASDSGRWGRARCFGCFFLLRKNENKMTRGKKIEERRMRCACVEDLLQI